MKPNTPDPPSSGSAAGSSSIEGIHAGTRYFVELGWNVAQAKAWLEDSMALAQLPMGSAAQEAARSSIVSQDGRFNFQIYRELEMLERQARATLLREITARLARRAATPGAAGLALLLPSSSHSRDALIERVQREGRRARSQRLHTAIRSLGVELSPLPCDLDAPGSIAAALAAAARWLWPGEVADLVEAEVELAFGNVAAAGSSVKAVLDSLPERRTDPGDEAESHEEAALREWCVRLLTLAHFLQGDADAALALAKDLPLVLDRSASMGALRAAAEFRAGGGGADTPEKAATVRDEFTAPIDTEERRRIAHFLALAHVTSSDARGPSEPRERRPRPVEGLPW